MYQQNIDNHSGKLHRQPLAKYLYNNGLLVQETIGDQILDYSYTSDGSILSVRYKANANDTGTYYYYALNSRGDVIGLYDEDGNLHARYTYDVWGNPISVKDENDAVISSATDIANIQPLRYRSYYYDSDTGFYYLQSRYYDPVTHRFINTDGLVSTGTGVLGHNMFTYCNNNPINRLDSNGQFWKQLNTWFKNTVNKVKQWVSKTYRKCRSWASSFFGASASTTSTITKSESYIIPDPSPITFKTGNKVTRTTYSTGDSSKPVSVYAVGSLDDQVFSSSAGLKLNYPNLTVKFNLAVDNIGIYGSVSKNNVTDSFGLRVNITQLKIGINSSSSVTLDNDTYTDYWDFDVSGWLIACAYLLVTEGVAEPSYAYSY